MVMRAKNQVIDPTVLRAESFLTYLRMTAKKFRSDPIGGSLGVSIFYISPD